MNRTRLIFGFVTGLLLIPCSSHAQYTGNFQTNIISGVTTSGPVTYNIGGIGDVLIVQNAGILVDGTGVLGPGNANSNNFALVTDSGSVWSNNSLDVGNNGAHNSLVISNGGQVINTGACTIGNGINPALGDNRVLITGPGSVLSCGPDLFIGFLLTDNRVTVENGGLLINNNNASFGSGSNNSAVVRGSGSIWISHGTMAFGGNGSSLVISNGGLVTDTYAYLGNLAGFSNTTVLVTGTGSVWSNQQDLYVGNFGSSNVLVVSGGGLVNNANTFVGYSSSSNNTVLVTDPGSVWSNRGPLGISSSAFNNLIISNGGQVISLAGGYFTRDKIVVTGTSSIWNSGSLHFDGGSLVISNNADVANSDAYAGYNATVSNLQVRVADGARWQNGALYVGYFGSSNSLAVAGRSVSATNLVVGFASANCNNLLQVDSGTVVVTNATRDAVLEVRHGQLVLNGGTIQADILVMTNTCASLVHTGGTLIVGSVVLDPNAFRITSVTRQGNDALVAWLMGPGQFNSLQASSGDGNGGYNTNGFTDLFIITNNTFAGTPTNYLDVGAGTNVPARYYRARLVP